MTDTLTCSVEGCNRPVKHNGLCSKHYFRQYRYGDPLEIKRTDTAVIQAWIEETARSDEKDCITWPFPSHSTTGYGRATYGGVRDAAHRIILRLADPDGEFEGAFALHTCGNGMSGCVNPNHLYWGTPKQNMDDRRAHGNAPQGSKSHHAKLKEADIVPIFEARASGKMPSEIAQGFGVSKGAINMILKRKTWKHVTIPAALLSAMETETGGGDA